MEGYSGRALTTLAADPYTSVLAIGCVAFDKGLLNSESQFPHVSNENNNPRLLGG